MPATEQISKCHPPRRGAVVALTVDSTARSYSIAGLALGAHTPEAANGQAKEVVLWMQAETNDVFFHFRSDSASADLSDTAKLAADGAAMTAFTATHGALLKAGLAPVQFTINRAIDKYLVVKAASTSGVLRFWAGSDAE